MDDSSVRDPDIFTSHITEAVERLESAETTLQNENEDSGSKYLEMIVDAKSPLTQYLETKEVEHVEKAADEIDQLYDSAFEELDDRENSITRDIWIAQVEVQEAISQIEMRPFRRETDTTVEMSSGINIGMLKAKIERHIDKIDEKMEELEEDTEDADD
jgi:hypothetical protein